VNKEALPLSMSRSELNSRLDSWHSWPLQKRIDFFKSMPRLKGEELFLHLKTQDQYEIVRKLTVAEKRSWLRLLEPDDAADVIQRFPQASQAALLDLIDHDTKQDITALLAYKEDIAGGLMNSRFITIRCDTDIDVAVRYLRAQNAQISKSSHYIYVVDAEKKLVGVVSFRDLLLSAPDLLVRAVMKADLVTLPEGMPDGEVSRVFARTRLLAIPVVDSEMHIKGIVTVDDVVNVVEENATKEIQNLGGSEALDEPYLDISFWKMIKKRAGWLTILFLGEMLTATAMGYFEKEIEKAVVLALFIPLIISSGGNSGSQATSLIIRSLALGEVRLRDWWKVFLKELSSGATLGVILGSVGFCRIMLWPTRAQTYGPHYILVALTVGFSLVGIVLWGSLAGSMLPFVLRRIGFDPAVASAPFVATLVDVTGLIIYFSVAVAILGGTLL
jgi:magnesium transporter